MSENEEQPESSEQTEAKIGDAPLPDHPSPPEAGEVTPPEPDPGNELEGNPHEVKDADVPWDVIQAQEGLPEGEWATGFFMFNGVPVLVCAGGFYGKHEGNVQRLPVKVLVDNI